MERNPSLLGFLLNVAGFRWAAGTADSQRFFYVANAFSSEEFPASSWPSLASSLYPTGIGGAPCLGYFLLLGAQPFPLKILKICDVGRDHSLVSQGVLSVPPLKFPLDNFSWFLTGD